MYYPRTSEEELPSLYEELDKRLETIEAALSERFPTAETSDGYVRVQFAAANAEDFVEAMSDYSSVLVQFFMKVSGYSYREFHRQHGVKNILRFDGRKTPFTDDEDALSFGEVLAEELPDEIFMETLLYSYAKLYENDQRRFVRMHYEKEVREWLTEQGIPNQNGEHLPGKPDVIIPESRPFKVTGEIRVYHPVDEDKRYKEFHDEAREAKENYPDAHFIVIANPGEEVVEDPHEREELREKIASEHIDAIFFHDELETDLLETLENWGIQRQETLSG